MTHPNLANNNAVNRSRVPSVLAMVEFFDATRLRLTFVGAGDLTEPQAATSSAFDFQRLNPASEISNACIQCCLFPTPETRRPKLLASESTTRYDCCIADRRWRFATRVIECTLRTIDCTGECCSPDNSFLSDSSASIAIPALSIWSAFPVILGVELKHLRVGKRQKRLGYLLANGFGAA